MAEQFSLICRRKTILQSRPVEFFGIFLQRAVDPELPTPGDSAVQSAKKFH
jgi:hypothetical protein